MKNWKGAARLFGHAAITGAISAIAGTAFTPDFDGKTKAIAGIALVGAVRAVADLLHRNPLDTPAPRPAKRSRIPAER